MNLKPTSSTKISATKIETEMVCPVCNLDHIPFERDLCPQCDADLTCFKVLDRLAAADASNNRDRNRDISTNYNPKPKSQAVVASMVGGLVLLGMGFMGFGFYKIQMIYSRLVLQQIAFKRTVDTVVSKSDLILAKQDQIISRISQELEHERRLLAKKKTPPTRTDAESSLDVKKGKAAVTRSVKGQLLGDVHIEIPKVENNKDDRLFAFYQASDTDTLWGIAERFYGAGYLYPVLLEHNPELSILHVSKRDRIAILKDLKEARRIFQAITVYENKRLYWYYTVRSGDTPSNIKARYCTEQECLPATFESNLNAEIPLGKKVKIELGKAVK